MPKRAPQQSELNFKKEKAEALSSPRPQFSAASEKPTSNAQGSTQPMNGTLVYQAAPDRKMWCAASRATLKRCELLQWAADQERLPIHLQGVLLRLVKLMDDAGAIALAQSKIAPLIGLGERQTRAAIKELVGAGVLKRTRQGAVGRGRAPDLLTANVDNGGVSPLSEKAHNGDSAPLEPLPRENCDNGDNGDLSPVSAENPDNGDNAVTLPVSHIEDAEFVDNSPAPCISTGARAQTQPLKTTSSEINLQRAESSSSSSSAPKILNGSAAGMPSRKLADILFAEVNSRWLDPSRCPDLNTSHARIRAWMAAGADFDSDIVPTIKAICSRPRTEPISSLIYFDKPMAAAIAKKARAEAPLVIEDAHDQSSSASRTSAAPERREPLNRATRSRMQRRAKREAEREAIDYGRVESERIG